MNPFVFKNRVKGIIVSYKSSTEFIKLVEDLKIDLIKTEKINKVWNISIRFQYFVTENSQK